MNDTSRLAPNASPERGSPERVRGYQPDAPASLIARWESYKLGRDLFAAREPMANCTNAECRRGYLDALRSAADADTFAYLTRGQSSC